MDNTVRYAENLAEIGLTRDDRNFYIRVWDDGPGIASRYLPYLFDRGWTPEVARREERTSSGLGLFIAQYPGQALRRRPDGGKRRRAGPGPPYCFHREAASAQPAGQPDGRAGGMIHKPERPPRPRQQPVNIKQVSRHHLADVIAGRPGNGRRPQLRPRHRPAGNATAPSGDCAHSSRGWAGGQPNAGRRRQRPRLNLPPTPLPTPTSAPTPTPTPAPTPTPTPAPTPTFTPPATPTPALTVTPGPGATTTPTPNPADLPVLVIESPLDRSIIRDESVTIEGITSIGASVSVRGRAVAAGEEGRFRLSVPLAPGINTLDVFAINPDGQRQVRTLTVTYLPVEPCFLTITQPDERDREVSQSTVRLWGRTAADATITVKGIAIPVDQLGIFSTTITLTPGLNSISVVATCTIGDTMQDILRETIEVNYLEAQP